MIQGYRLASKGFPPKAQGHVSHPTNRGPRESAVRGNSESAGIFAPPGHGDDCGVSSSYPRDAHEMVAHPGHFLHEQRDAVGALDDVLPDIWRQALIAEPGLVRLSVCAPIQAECSAGVN